MNKLLVTVSALIGTKREGDYWDFKREHYKNKASLLHDILCMANSRHDQDCLIILGVDDQTATVIGVENDLSRKNQQQLIDFLRSKKFAGDNCPVVELHTLTIEEHEIDVIVVMNTLDTPYYLTMDFREKDKNVRANAIYTRIGDTNTPIDKAADYSHVEYLWKKRLGLHLTPFRRLCWLLMDKAQWIEGEEGHYNRNHPEFTLSFEDDERNREEFYSFVMTNESTSYGMVRAKYYGTTLYSHATVYLDGGRYLTVTPSWEFIHYGEYDRKHLSFKYYTKDNIAWLLHRYLYDQESGEARYARDGFLEVVLVFESENEKADFLLYIDDNIKQIIEEVEMLKIKNMQRVYKEEPAKNRYAASIAMGYALNKFLLEFRTQKFI